MTLKFGANLGLLSGGAPGEEHYDEIVAQWRGFDALVQGSVTSAATTSPPVSPSNGDCYIIPVGATGTWAGKTGKIARWTTDTAGSQWEYYTPRAGWKLFNVATGQDFRYDGATWAAIDSGISYEGGDFSLSWSGSPLTGVFRYTKIGKRVFYDIATNVTISSGSPYMELIGLPYPAKSLASYVAQIPLPDTQLFRDFIVDSDTNLQIRNGESKMHIGQPTHPTGGTYPLNLSGSYETN